MIQMRLFLNTVMPKTLETQIDNLLGIPLYSKPLKWFQCWFVLSRNQHQDEDTHIGFWLHFGFCR